MLGLYIHIPFCRKRCHYCDFVVTTKEGPVTHGLFLSALEKEMAFHQESFKGQGFDTLYLGGGTPSQLTSDEIRRLFSSIRKNFTLRADAEITCEVNPESIDEEKARVLKAEGTHRLSLGVQSFHEKTLRRLNRAHDEAAIFRSFEALKTAGFQNISLDLMLSLPGETMEHVKLSLRKAVDLGPTHVSLYELTLQPGTVFKKQFDRQKLRLPPEEESLQMLFFARDFLKESGFRHYELLSYAKPGFESRHNRIYWANQPYLGLGPGAFSYWQGRRFQFSNDFEDYLKKIQDNHWNVVEEEALSSEKRALESFLLSLRLMEGADMARFQSVLSESQGSIRSLEGQGLLIRENGRLRLTAQGEFFAETVFTELSAP